MTVSTIFRRAIPLIAALVVSACGTTYNLPDVDDSAAADASKMFATTRAEPPRRQASPAAGEARFTRVASRVQPVARKLCERELDENKRVDCNVRMELDRSMEERNAYFTYVEGEPTIRFTVPMLQDVESDDEVAFIMGHEYGHLIGQHIQKAEQQAIAGALILGVITAAANAQSASAGVSYDPNAVERNMQLGAAAGQKAFSQTYELESDMLGTRIAAAAGYDPVKGAKFFARDEAARSTAGKLSFWGTHPADSKRLALVIATKREIEAQQGLSRRTKAP